MRDGKGNKLSAEEEAKIRESQIVPGGESLNKVSVDPTPVKDMDKKPEPPETTTAPKF